MHDYRPKPFYGRVFQAYRLERRFLSRRMRPVEVIVHAQWLRCCHDIAVYLYVRVLFWTVNAYVKRDTLLH